MRRSPVSFGRSTLAAMAFTGLLLATLIWTTPYGGVAMAQGQEDGYTTDFRLEDCTFRTKGDNPYFSLQPGYQVVLEGDEEDDEGEMVEIRSQMTVLDETQEISLSGVGTIKTRVVEEREWEDGELIEVSRNFFALCKETNAVYYFGEDVDLYEDGEIVGHEGAWRTGVDGALPGMIMPGTFLLGAKYYQEYAPNVALDRADNLEMGLTVTTEAGVFDDCVKILDTSSLEPGAGGDEKIYCPGVGLVADAGLRLVSYGQVSDGGTDQEIIVISGFDMNLDDPVNVGDAVRFAVDASSSNGADIYYRFDLVPDYGTDNYDPINNWEMIRDFSTDPTYIYTFNEPGSFIVVVWASATQSIPQDVAPLFGGSVTVE